MNFDFSINLFGAWCFVLVYLIFAYGLWFLFPSYIQIRFSRIPKIKYVTNTYQILYLLFLVLSIFISIELNIWFYLGLFIYLVGLSIYISAIYYFAINEWNKPVMSGIYRYFRHPVYFGFFLIMLGISLAALSYILFLLSIFIAYLSYLIAQKEEQQCVKDYGNLYSKYLKKNSFIFKFKI